MLKKTERFTVNRIASFTQGTHLLSRDSWYDEFYAEIRSSKFQKITFRISSVRIIFIENQVSPSEFKLNTVCRPELRCFSTTYNSNVILTFLIPTFSSDNTAMSKRLFSREFASKGKLYQSEYYTKQKCVNNGIRISDYKCYSKQWV